MRWGFKVGFVLLFLIVVLPAALACDLDGTCEVGESLNSCEDRTSAYCGDLTCDPGLGEHLEAL